MRGDVSRGLASTLLASASALASAATLTVTIKNVRNAEGMVCVAVYDRDSSFLKLDHARLQMKVKAAKGDVVLTLKDLTAGQYAVTVFHDENNNGKLDKNWLGMPVEGYGFSNDIRARTRPPSFAQTAFPFQADADEAISFSMQY